MSNKRAFREKYNVKILFWLKVLIGIIIGLMIVIPIYMMIISSFKDTPQVFDSRFWPKTFDYGGYVKVFQEKLFRYFLNTLFVATVVAAGTIIFSSMAGYALARLKFVGRNIIFVWILSNLMMPFAVLVVPLFIIVKKFGWVNNFYGVTIPAIPSAIGIFLYRQFFLTLPNELAEAATIDGCSRFGVFARIFFPLCKPITITLAVIVFIFNWNDYLWPLVVNSGGETKLLQIALSHFIGRDYTPWNAILAGGVIAVIPTMIIYFILQKQIVEGIKMTGMK